MKGFYFRLYCALVLLYATSFAMPLVVSAQPCPNSGLFERPLPGSPPCIDTLISGGTPLTSYISVVIVFLTVLIVAVGVIAIVVGGYLYMTAGGSGDRVQLAKSIVAAAIIGIVLALTAFVLLSTISPEFSQPGEPCIADTNDACAPFTACPGSGRCPSRRQCSPGAALACGAKCLANGQIGRASCRERV